MDEVVFEDVREAFPDFHDWYSISYAELINTMNITILVQENYGSYQGETLMLIRDNNDNQKHGIINFSWGSCTVCDMLKGCSSYEELEKIRDRLYSMIYWSEEDPDGSKIIGWWIERDIEALESIYDSHHEGFVEKIKEYINVQTQSSVQRR